MSDEADKTPKSKFSLPSSERSQSGQSEAEQPNVPLSPEDEIEAAAKKTFKLKRPTTRYQSRPPMKAPTKPPMRAASKPPFPESDSETSQTKPTSEKNTEWPPPPKNTPSETTKEPTQTPEPTTPPPLSTDHIAKNPPQRPQDFNPEDPFSDVLPSVNPKTGRSSTRAPFPTQTKATASTASKELRMSRATTRNPIQNKPAARSNTEASRRFEQKMQQLQSPSPAKRSKHLVSILVIIGLVLILLGAAAGIWLVLFGDNQTLASIGASETGVAPSSENHTNPTHSDQNGSTEALNSEPKEVVVVQVTANSQGAITDFLNKAYIGGMRSGQNPRVMLNEVTYGSGEVVDPKTGLKFKGIEEQRLVFEGADGVLYMKSF